jgi:hypothetical protein
MYDALVAPDEGGAIGLKLTIAHGCAFNHG